MSCFFFFNDTATTEIYTLSLHDALPIWEVDQPGELLQGPDVAERGHRLLGPDDRDGDDRRLRPHRGLHEAATAEARSEEHTSELQSRQYLVCRLLLEKKKNKKTHNTKRR